MRPIASGLNPRGSRAARICVGVTITSENAPSTRRKESASASGSVFSRDRASKCTITSVSLVVWKMEPCASSRLRNTPAFTRLPLCASAIMPLFDCTMIGWAFNRAESPDVE